MTPAIDVHTHMLNRDWLELLRAHGRPRYEVRPSLDAPEGIFLDGAPFMTPQPGHFDYPYRIRQMDAAGVDLAIISLTCPNVYWGGRDVSLKAARIVNDDMAAAQTAYPARIRWLCSLPWEYPDAAVDELRRASDQGAVGVMVLANIAGRTLTDPLFAPIWSAIDRRALPVLIHPTAPPGTPEMALREFNLIASIGFMFDTSLAVARLLFDGFLDRYPDVKLIVSHEEKMGVRFEGDLGWAWGTRGKHEASSPEIYRSAIGEREIRLYASDDHVKNFVDCVVERKQSAAPVEVSHRSVTIAHLGNIAMRTGRNLLWNPRTEQILDDEGANQMLSRPARAPWGV